MLFLLTSLLLVGSSFQIVTFRAAAQNQTEQSTEEPSSTPVPRVVPISPWELILLVFTFVGLSAVVLSVLQRLRRTVSK